MNEFTVRKGKKHGKYGSWETQNVIQVDESDWLELGSYAYGCEGDGHFFETILAPGRYKVIRLDALRGEYDE